MLKELIDSKIMNLVISREKLDETKPSPIEYSTRKNALDAKIEVLEEMLKQEQISKWIDIMNDFTEDTMIAMKKELSQEEILDVLENMDGFIKGRINLFGEMK